MRIKIIWAKLKDRLLPKVPVFSYSPAPCPLCGFVVQVPLIRSPMAVSCNHCSTTIYTMAVGIVDYDKDRLEYIYSEVVETVKKSSIVHSSMQANVKNTIN